MRWPLRCRVRVAALAAAGLLASAAHAQSPAASDAPASYTVVLSSWLNAADAERARQQAAAGGVPAVVVRMTSTQGMRYRVCLGRYDQRADAEADRQEVQQRGYADAWLLNLSSVSGGSVPATAPGLPKVQVQTQASAASKPAAAKPNAASPAPELPADALTAADTAGLARWLQSLTAALATRRPEAVRPYLHPSAGMYLLYQPQRVPLVHQADSYAEALEARPLTDSSSWRSLLADLQAYAAGVQAGELPTRNCVRGTWSAAGVWAGSMAGRDKKLRRLQTALKRATLNEALTPTEDAAAQAAEALVTHAVLYTGAQRLHALLLHRTGMRWYLLGLDLLPPCDL